MTLIGVLIFSSVELLFPHWFWPIPSATIYHLNGNSYADLLERGHAHLLNVDGLPSPEKRYEVRNHHHYYAATEWHDFMLEPANQQRWPFIKLLGKRIVRLESALDFKQPLPPVDMVWMGKNVTLENIQAGENVKPLFVLDGSINRWRAKDLSDELKLYGIKVHDTWEDGALNWQEL